MTLFASFRTAVHREPIIMWSFIIGGIGEWPDSYRESTSFLIFKQYLIILSCTVGLALPVVVPPVREALGYNRPSPIQPPPVRELIERAKQ